MLRYTPAILVINLLVSSSMLLLDQWSKNMAQVHARDPCISCGQLVRIQSTTNRNRFYASYSGRVALVLGWFAALAAAVLLRRSGLWFQSERALIGLALALGGAAGNLLDILRRRCIVDFIEVRWWPAFNLADVAIVSGLLMAFWPRG